MAVAITEPSLAVATPDFASNVRRNRRGEEVREWVGRPIATSVSLTSCLVLDISDAPGRRSSALKIVAQSLRTDAL